MRFFPKTQARRGALLVGVVAYILLMSFGGWADVFILHPSTEPDFVSGTTRRVAGVPGRGRVELWTARSEGARSREPEAFVLEFVGNASRAEPMAKSVAEEWGDRPVEVWALNYPGYGGSDGPAQLRSIGSAALAAHDTLRDHAGDRPIFVTGQSLGTTAALYVAANRPVAGTALWSPPPLRDMILRRFGWWNLWLLAGPIASQVPEELDSIGNAKRVVVPGVFVATGQDTVVPVAYQTKVSDAYAGPKRYIRVPMSQHNAALVGDSIPEYQRALDWLWASMKKDRMRGTLRQK